MTEEYLFLGEDLEALKAEVGRLQNENREIGQEKALATSQSSETWHDNFGFEETNRQQMQYGARIGQLMRIISHARIVPWPGLTELVAIGHTVTVENPDTGEKKTFRIGSYLTPGADSSVIPYSSPIGRALLKKAKGETVSAKLPAGIRKYKIIEIEL